MLEELGGTSADFSADLEELGKTSADFSADLEELGKTSPDFSGDLEELEVHSADFSAEYKDSTGRSQTASPLSGIIHESLGRDEQPSIKPDLRPGGELSTVRPTPRKG